MYAEPGDLVEAPLDGYRVDILRGDLVIEIQTAGFASISRKLRDLVQRHPVRLVHPVATERWIVKLPPRGDGPSTRRKSPRRVGFEELCQELVSFPDLIGERNFELEAVAIREEELRRPGRRRRRPGWVVVERRLLEIVDRMRVRSPDDLLSLLPPELPDPFRTSDLASSLGRPRALAQKVAYCLRKCGAIRAIGKDRNGVLYSRSGD